MLLIEAARALGFGAHVVSGYLLPLADGGVGADATHAWAEIFVPGPGWIAFDPTNERDHGARLPWFRPQSLETSPRQFPSQGAMLGPATL